MKQKTLLLAALVFLGVCVIMTSCKKDDPPAQPTAKDCPDVTSNASLTAGTIGLWVIGHEGDNGKSNYGNSLTDCGWTTYGTETGGVNNTYALQKLNASNVLSEVMRWEYSTFWEFELHTGWQGATEKGLHMGDSVYKFQAAYGTTNFHPQGAYIDRYELVVPGAETRAILDFTSATGALTQVVVTKN